MNKTRNELLEEILANINGGGGTFNRVDAGALTNTQILALSSPAQLTMAFSTDDFINYTFFNSNWYSTGGGILV